MQVIRMLTVVTTLLSACGTGLARDWVYSDPYAKPSPFIQIEQMPPKISAGHITAPWQGCPAAQRDKYSICIESHALTFAVPKGAAQGSKWSFGGKNFVAEVANDVRLLGRSERVLVITESDDPAPMQYLYSLDAGLLGMRMVQGSKSAFLVINGQCGFGATESCYTTPAASK